MSLRENAIRRHMNELAAQATPMSRVDSVVVTQAEPEAVGVYIDADQVRQDAYAEAIAQQQMQKQPEGYVPVVPIVSPNTQVVEAPTRARASTDGNVVIYY